MQICVCVTSASRRSQDFVWGCNFFPQKVDDLFLVVALKDRLNIPPNLSHQAKTVLKIDSCSGWEVHFMSCGRGALSHFSFKLGLKKIFSPPWGCMCTHCTPWLRLWVPRYLSQHGMMYWVRVTMTDTCMSLTVMSRCLSYILTASEQYCTALCYHNCWFKCVWVDLFLSMMSSLGL